MTRLASSAPLRPPIKLRSTVAPTLCGRSLAHQTELVVFNADDQPDSHGPQPGADVALYLARHGVKVTVISRTISIDTGEALLSLAADLGSDLIVMGAYGHSRFREIILGGVTRTMLSSMTVPVLMTH